MTNNGILLLLRHATGLDLSEDAVERAIRMRMKQCQMTDRDQYAVRALNQGDELNALIDLTVVPETWFFRDSKAFAAAARFAIERLANGARLVRMLSIPCSTGEEPYSLAMALLDAQVDPSTISIDAVDISHGAIDRARQGVYFRNAFRSSDLGFRRRYFIEEGDAYRLQRPVREMVNFQCGNLLTFGESASLSRYDIIFCRNLLIYFDEPTQQAAIRKLHALLAGHGVLFSGHAEISLYSKHEFVMANYAGAFVLRKNASPDAPVKPRQSAPRRRNIVKPVASAAPVRRQQPAAASCSASDAGPGKPDRTAPDALLLEAKQLADQGNLHAAVDKYRAYLGIVPDSADAYFMLGLISEHDRDIEQAEAALRRAVYLDPNHYDALCHLALLTEIHGNAADAIALRERAARVFRRRSEE